MCSRTRTYNSSIIQISDQLVQLWTEASHVTICLLLQTNWGWSIFEDFELLLLCCYFCDWIMTNDYWGWLVTHAWCYSLDWCWWQEWDNAGWALCLHNFLVVNRIHDWFGNCYINISTSAHRTSDPIWYKDTIDWNWIY